MNPSKRLFDGALTKKDQTMNIWQASISVTEEQVPVTDIVGDRFHLVKYLNKAIDKVRRQEVKTEEELKDSRYALLKNPDNLTDKQRLKFQVIQNANYQVGKVWQVRENFKDLFREKSEKAEGLTLFTQWSQAALRRGATKRVAQTFKGHLAGVVNALAKASNAMAERGKIQKVKFSGRGYRRFKTFRSATCFSRVD